MFRSRALFSLAALLVVSCTDDSRLPSAPTAVLSPVHRNSSLSADEVRTILGPVTITRSTGAPVTSTYTLEGFGPVATLRIANGDAHGKRRATSGTLSVDGVQVVGNDDFGNKVASITRTITLKTTSSVAVQLHGSPGDMITLSIDGTLATSGTAPPSGGTLHLLGEQVTIVVPPGAVGAPVELTAEQVVEPDSAGIPGTTVEFGPSGTTFATPITVSIAFDPAALPAGARAASLAMYLWNVDHWEAVPGSTVDLANGIVSAQVSHFSTYSLLPGDIEFCPTNPTAEQVLNMAVTHVAPNGTVAVCSGTHAIPSSRINKPMTLRSLITGGATLADAEPGGTNQAGTPIINVNGIASGTVRFADIGFYVTDQGITPSGTFDLVVIDSSRFSGPVGAVNVGVKILPSTVAGARVEFINSTMTDMGLGIWPVAAVETNTRRSTFDRFTGGAIDYSSSGTPTGQSFGVIEYNTLSNCATAGCLRLLTAGALWVHHNTMTAAAQPVTLGAITVQAGGSSSMPTPGALIIEDNTITSAATSDPANTPTGWQFQNGIYVSDANLRTLVIRRNTITNAYGGFFVSNTDVDIRDNVVTGGFYAFRQSVLRPAVIERNDFTGQLNSFTAQNATANFRCNWWGSASGPTSPPANLGSTFAPWANAPIAGTANVCNSSVAGYPALRVCSTPGGTDPTVATAAQAVSFVSPGGIVRFCDGTHSVANVTIGKPLTLTAEGPGRPVIDAAGQTRAFNIINVAGAGTVTISGLRFINSVSQQVNVSNSPGTVVITNNEFAPNNTNAFGVAPFGNRAAIAVNNSTAGVWAVTIDHNVFQGGDVGINGGTFSNMTLAITQNTFVGQFAAGVSIGNGTNAASLLIDYNVMSDCGINNCIFVAQPASIVGNQLTMRLARKPFIMIQTNTTSATPVVISGNSIIGVDLGATARNNNITYPTNIGINVGGGAATITGNIITRAFTAIGLNQNGSSAFVATDNYITTVGAPFTNNALAGSSNVTANWNNATDYVGAVFSTGGFNLGTLNLRCNWWGAVTGPVGMPGAIPAAAYTPFATAAVAGGPHTGCTP